MRCFNVGSVIADLQIYSFQLLVARLVRQVHSNPKLFGKSEIIMSSRILKLTIKNFRGIQELEWHPSARMNFVLGGGDTGKTTVLVFRV